VQFIDLQQNGDIEVITEMLRQVSLATDPSQVLEIFGPYFRRKRPSDVYLGVSVRGLKPGEYKITRKFRFDPDGDAVENLNDVNPWRDWDRLPTYTGGLIGQLIARGEPSLIHHLDAADDPAIGDIVADMGACLASPHFDRGEPTNWAISFVRDPEGFDIETVDEAFLLGSLLGTVTRQILSIAQTKSLNRQLQSQFEEVARVQRSLLPSRIPDIPGLEIATSYLTSDEAGGDYYDFFEFRDGSWGIVIADVAGHGAGAATVMAMLRAILHGFAHDRQTVTPDDILNYTNMRLHDAGIDGRFVTAFFAVYDPKPNKSGNPTLTYARSGHNPPRIKEGKTGVVRPLDEAGTVPLGVFETYKACSACIELHPDDTVVLYTDGITEAFNTSREMFGVDRLDSALTNCSGNPDCTVDSVHTALYAHTGKLSRDDDQTIVTFRYVGQGTPDNKGARASEAAHAGEAAT
jgi:phosphoserine phosphatase RsbU/P